MNLHVSMWPLLRACQLYLFVASVGAYAQSGNDPASAVLPKAQLPSVTAGVSRTPTEEEIRAQGTKWHDECMGDWDQQTHMTKQEWARTCHRVVDDRVKWLRGQGKQ
jgi:hypothetical protein